jgi:hypothetical protein
VSPRKAFWIKFIGILAVVATIRCLYAGDQTLEAQLDWRIADDWNMRTRANQSR